MTGVDGLRVFIAIDTPPAVKRGIIALVERLRPHGRNARWEEPQKYHCTLQFLGNVERGLLEPLAARVRAAAAGIPPLPVTYGKIGFFPDDRAPRVLWVGISDEGGGLFLLKERLADQLAQIGFRAEERPFHPHVTLARLAPGGRHRTLTDTVETLTFEHPPVIIPAVEIMQSVLQRNGSAYTVLRTIPLEGRAGTAGEPPGMPAA